MDLEDCAGFDDSDVYPEGGLGIVGPVNSLMPRFDQEDSANQPTRSTKKDTNSRKASLRQLSGGRRSGGVGRLMSPSHVPEAQATQTMLKVPASVISTQIQKKFKVVEDLGQASR